MNGLTILLVDDDREIRTLITEFLGLVGHDVLEAGSGREAIEIIESDDHSIDIAIVDWQMEGISGRDVISRLRSVEPATKVLLVTGRGAQELPESMLSKIASGILRKPFSMKSLQVEITRLAEN